MNKLFTIILLLFSSILIIGCSDDDESYSDFNDEFLEGVITSATTEQLKGSWAIIQAEFEGQYVDIPINIPECGRDFFEYNDNGQYREYIFNNSSDCIPDINMVNWSLSEGIITLTQGSTSEKYAITELTDSRLAFNVRVDVDGDGKLDVMNLICTRYSPPMEIDIYSGTFQWQNSSEHLDKIYLTWDKYRGYNEFEKYEIYRLNENCSTTNAELIATITDKEQNFFIDEFPPIQEKICYQFKIYTNQGLLGESQSISVNTESLNVPLVQQFEPVISNGTIQLSWEAYTGYYFSHYEVEVRNYSSGYGGGFEEESLAIINSINSTNFLIENPPYFANPVFVIHAYNIFGKRTSSTIEGVNQRSTQYVRDEILPYSQISFPQFDFNETILHFYANGKMVRYNYVTKTIESSYNLNSGSVSSINLIQSEEYGKELIVLSGNIKVFNADNLQLKYEINYFFNPTHMAVTDDGYWLITDRNQLQSFRRDDSSLIFLSSNSLYNENFSSSTIGIMDIKEGRILVGNYTKPNGLIVGIDSNGMLSEAQTVPINLTSAWENNSLFSEANQYVLNIADKTLYSTVNYSLQTTFDEFFPSGLGDGGNLILGTNNNPETGYDNFHEKKIRILSFPSMQSNVYDSNGYPHLVHKNHLGQIVSLSKGLVGSLSQNAVVNDIFVEIIE